ncbi:MAG: MaoC family dehydratase N-terminal domain-containing protein [Desulfomonilaceae bacterium]|nr:MaoC family dehydratase N-terminal domain-containing protein [Desulfomonilaceae bacterium]
MKESLLDSLGWRKYIGQETSTHTGEPVLARDIRRYALAVDDHNPIFFDENAAKEGKYRGLTAPMGYISWAVGVPGSEKAAKDLGEDGLATFVGVPEIPDAWTLGWVRGGEEIEFIRPVYVNDRVTVRGKIVDMSEKAGKSGSLIFVTSEFVYTNQDGQELARHRVTMIATPRKES